MALTWSSRCLIWGFVSTAIAAYVMGSFWMEQESFWARSRIGNAASVILALVSVLSAMVAVHISTLRCSETHTLKTLLMEYFLVQGIDLRVKSTIAKMMEVWKNPRQAQEALLRNLIARDENTEYGRRYLKGIETLQDFQQKHPLTKYDHYEEYFQRLADGEKNVCVAAKVERFGTSSGTTGKGKLIPIVLASSTGPLITAISRYVCKSSPLQKAAVLYCKPLHKMSKSGLHIAASFFVPESTVAKLMVEMFQNAPFSAFQISTDFEATYVDILFALTDKNLFVLFAPFASQIYRAFTMLEDHQDMFLEDLTLGRVSQKLNIDEGVRRSLDAALKPDLARVEELRREFARGFEGILNRIWPHMFYVLTIDISGYMKKLSARYTKGTKLFSLFYGCTEAMIGVNLWLDGRSQQYVLIPNDSVIEFIPEQNSDEENPSTLLIDEVKIGKRYEIAITTPSGFYRYRMGDVVEVVDFHERCPVIQVKYRTGEMFNLRSEKIDKLVVTKAIEESLADWSGATLVEWTCAESPLMYGDQEVTDYDMYYLLFVELEGSDLNLSSKKKAMFDKHLRKQHEFYDNYRKAGTICEARVFVVRPGSFRKLQEFIIATSTASYNQFKMPKKLRTKATLDLMMECADRDEVKS